MSCDQERVTGFVDGELDAETARAVEVHLVGCAGCRAQVDAERRLRAALRALPAPELPRGLEARVTHARPARGVSTAVRYLLPLAASLVLGLWLRGHAPFVAWDLARDHDKCFSRQPLPAVVWSAEPRLVEKWFAEQGTDMPALPAAVGELRLVGARYCPLVSLSSAPHVYYASDGGGHVSLFVVPHAVRVDRRHDAAPRRDLVRLMRVGGRLVGIVGEDRSQVQAFEQALGEPVVAALQDVEPIHALDPGGSDGAY